MRFLLVVLSALLAGALPAHAGLAAVAALVANGVGWFAAASAVYGAVVAELAIGLAVQVVTSALTKAFARKASGLDSEAKSNVQLSVDMGDTLPLKFIMGDYATAGNRKYINSWGANDRYITEVVEVSSLPQPGLAAMWVNEEAGRIDWSAMDKDGTAYDLGYPVTNLDDNGHRIWLRWYDGTQTAADPMLVGLFGNDPKWPWTAHNIGTGKSYAIITTRYDSDTLTSYPTWLWQPKPLPVYDPRKDDTVGGSGAHRWGDRATYEPSRNVAVIAYNICRGIYLGDEWVFGCKNLDAWRLPLPEWTAAMNACDAPVTGISGASEPAYRCGLQISVDSAAADVLQDLAAAGNMKFAEVGGMLKPLVGLPASPAFSFTDADLLITQAQSLAPFYPLSKTFNAISATYPEPQEKWTSKDVPEYVNAPATAEDGGDYRPISVDYSAVPYLGQVQRLMQAQLLDDRRQRIHQLYLTPEVYAIEPGIDTVAWSSARNGYDAKLFLVESVTKLPGLCVAVSIREVDPADLDPPETYQPVPITTPVNPIPFTQAIDGFTVTAETITGDAEQQRPAIGISCTGDEVGVTSIRLQVRNYGSANPLLDVTRPFDAPYQWTITDVLPGTKYQVQAKLLSDLTPKSDWSGWITVTTPDVRFGSSDLDQSVQDQIDTANQNADDAITKAADAVSSAGQAIDQAEAAGQLATTASKSAGVAVSLAGQGSGVLTDQYLGTTSGFDDWSTATSKIANEVYPTGQTWVFDLDASTGGGFWISSDSANWTGQKNADAYVVEVEFTLVSGSIDSGCGILFDYNQASGSGFWDIVKLADMLQGPVTLGAVQTARAVVARPADFAGTFANNQFYLMLNTTENNFGAMSAREIHVHRVSIRTASAEEQGLGNVAAAVSAEAAARANADSALSQSITTLTATVNGQAASISENAATVAQLSGYASATWSLQAKAGGSTGLLELIATTDAGGETASAFRVSAEDILLDGSVTAQQIKVGSLSADAIGTGKLDASFLTISSLLSFSNVNAGLSFGKTGATDFSTDGIYLGRQQNLDGSSGFGFLVGKTAADGTQQYIQHTSDDGLSIVNAKFKALFDTSSGAQTVTSGQTIVLDPTTQTISLSILGAGGGTSANGGATTVQLYDGDTLKKTWTSAGGVMKGSGTYYGVNSALGTGGTPHYTTTTTRRVHTGGGGSEGDWETVTTTTVTNATGATGYGAGSGGNQDAGNYGGGAASLVSVSNFDVSNYANPKLVIIIGAKVAGPDSTFSSPGVVQYSSTASPLIPCGPVPKIPTATGQLTVPANANWTFPDLGAGLWVVSTQGGGPVNIGWITIDKAGHQLRLYEPTAGMFISGITPTVQASANSSTLNYLFYSLGEG